MKGPQSVSTVIANGTVVTADMTFPADIRIEAVEPPLAGMGWGRAFQ